MTPVQHFMRLASRPRPTGTAAAEEARGYCADVLRNHGFTVTERAFEYSAFAGRIGTPLAGLWLGLTISLAACFALRDSAAGAVLILAAAIVALVVVGRHIGTTGILSLPVMRRNGVNLEAVRGDRDPAVWLVAHIDSKWQPVPMVARAAGIVLLALATATALTLGLVQWSTGTGGAVWTSLVIVTWFAAVPVMSSVVGDRGPGAVDNASGVASVLAAAELLPGDSRAGVLITDAEELGLAGARAWVRGRAAGTALNCDGVDDTGQFTVMWSGRPPRDLARRFREAALQNGETLRIIRMIPGVLADSVAFAEAGWTSATLSRGSLRTLRRIHAASDDATAMRGTAIATAARILARVASDLN